MKPELEKSCLKKQHHQKVVSCGKNNLSELTFEAAKSDFNGVSEEFRQTDTVNNDFFIDTY